MSKISDGDVFGVVMFLKTPAFGNTSQISKNKERELKSTKQLILLYALVVLELFIVNGRVLAQPLPPERDYLFLEDKEKKEKKDKSTIESEAIKQKKKELEALEKSGQLPFDINAKNINFDSSGNKLLADGGLMIKYSSMVLEALKGVVDLGTNEVTVSGDVRLSDLSGNLTADSAKLNFDAGTGKLENADIYFAEGDFQLRGEEVAKTSNDTYELTNSTLTTCQCAEGKDCPPWRLRANKTKIVRDGYGQAWGAKLDVLNVPVFYTPYMIFPAKTERQTGLLAPSFGGGRHSGFQLFMPFFWAINGSSDATITPLVETNVRVGLDTEYRKEFSKKSDLNAGLVYLNDTMRGSKLLGTNVSNISDPSFDTNRFAGYWYQHWKGNVEDIPLQFVAKGRYVSDDLILREYDSSKIGKFNTRFVTSRATFRAPISSGLEFDLSSEWNQDMVQDDDFVFQRLPEAELDGLKVFHPFGDNPFGLKLVSETDLSVVNFSRTESYDGSRSEAYQDLKIPFHFRNYFDGSVEGDVRGSYYAMTTSKVINPSGSDKPPTGLPSEYADSSDRVIPGFTGKLNTAVERVFDLDDDNLLKTVGDLGPLGRTQELKRVKHTIEPGIKYKYVPDVDQSDNPQYDSIDHLAQKSLITYGVTQRLFGRYEPRNPLLYGIEETAPEVTDIGNLRSAEALDNNLAFGWGDDQNGEGFQKLRTGSLRELATLKLSQSYDFNEADNNTSGSSSSAYSDVSSDLILYPNDYISLRARNDFNVDDSKFDAYTLESQLQDKRGDVIRARLRSNQKILRQLESNVECRLTDNFRVGYYNRYDDLTSRFIEQKVGLRYVSKCKCWIFDVDLGEKTNPDETRVMVNLTLVGLGEINQRVR